MPLLELPKEYHPDFAYPGKKPEGPVEIDWFTPNSLLFGLLGYWIFRPYPHDLVTNQLAPVTGTEYGIEAYADLGQHIAFDAPNTGTYAGYTRSESENWKVGTGDFTIACVYKTPSSLTSTAEKVIQCGRAFGGGRRFGFDVKNNGVNIDIDDNSSDTGASFGGGTIDPDIWYNAVITFDRSGNAELYFDGEGAGGSIDITGTSGDLDDPNWGLRFGAQFDSGGSPGQCHRGSIAFAALWNRLLDAEEIRRVCLDRYQILKPVIPEVCHFPSGSAGSTIAVAQVTETDLAQDFTVSPGGVAVPVGFVSETDAAQMVTPVAGAVTIAVGQVAETDLAQAISGSVGGISAALGLASETDLSQPFTVAAGGVTVALGQVTESDQALAFSVSQAGNQTVAMGQITESNNALTLTPVAGGIAATLGQVAETDLAQAMTVDFSTVVSMGLVTEADSALVMSSSVGPISLEFGLVTETDEARPVTPVAVIVQGYRYRVPANIRTIRVQADDDHQVGPKIRNVKVLQ